MTHTDDAKAAARVAQHAAKRAQITAQRETAETAALADAVAQLHRRARNTVLVILGVALVVGFVLGFFANAAGAAVAVELQRGSSPPGLPTSSTSEAVRPAAPSTGSDASGGEISALRDRAAWLSTSTTSPRRPARVPVRADAGASPERAPGELLDCIAHWESERNGVVGSGYGAVNPSGKYRGRYQMDTAFWLAYGGDPAYASRHEQAPPEMQDAVALAGYEARGLSPWPTPSRKCR